MCSWTSPVGPARPLTQFCAAAARSDGVPSQCILPTPHHALEIRVRVPDMLAGRNSLGTRAWRPQPLRRTRDRRSRGRDHGRRCVGARTNYSGGTHSLSASRYGWTDAEGPTPRHGGKSVETRAAGSPELSLVSGRIREVAPGLHEQLLHQVSRVPAMSTWGAHRRQPAFASPVGDRARRAPGALLGVRVAGASPICATIRPFLTSSSVIVLRPQRTKNASAASGPARTPSSHSRVRNAATCSSRSARSSSGCSSPCCSSRAGSDGISLRSPLAARSGDPADRGARVRNRLPRHHVQRLHHEKHL